MSEYFTGDDYNTTDTDTLTRPAWNGSSLWYPNLEKARARRAASCKAIDLNAWLSMIPKRQRLAAKVFAIHAGDEGFVSGKPMHKMVAESGVLISERKFDTDTKELQLLGYVQQIRGDFTNGQRKPSTWILRMRSRHPYAGMTHDERNDAWIEDNGYAPIIDAMLRRVAAQPSCPPF